MNIVCKYCQSENVYYSKKNLVYKCEDCEKSFNLEEKLFHPRKVFLSYGHDENAFLVDLIYQKLKERGHEPWIDKSEIKAGNDWREKICQGILESNGFLSFISKYSVRIPGVCLDEISIGISNYYCRVSSVLLEKGVEPPNSIAGIQWLDLSDWKVKKQELSKATWEKWFDEKMDIIFQIVEDEKNIIISGNISQLEKQLLPIKTSLKMKKILQNEIVKRDWLVKEIMERTKSLGALVIYGSPGSGKSVLSAYLSNFTTQCAAAYFFEWNNSYTKAADKFVCTLIFQLACTVEDYQVRVLDLLKKYSLADMGLDEIIDQLLLEPLNSLIDGNRETKLILLDAIDEALTDQEELLDTLIRVIDHLPRWIKIIMTSRPESIILEKFQKYDQIDMDNHRNQIFLEISEYVRQQVNDTTAAKTIIEKCETSFLFAKEMINIYREGNINLGSIPLGISGVYFTYFNRTFNDSEKYAKYYRPILEIMLVVKEQISINEIIEILDISRDNIILFLKKMRSYVYVVPIGEDSILQIFHKSFFEWLNSAQASGYRVFESAGHQAMVKYICKCSEKNEFFSQYLTKYTFSHMDTQTWENQSLDLQVKILNKLIISAEQFGYLELEKKYLDLYRNTFGVNTSYHLFALNYFKKISGALLLKEAEEAILYCQQLENEQERFNLTSQISISYFYCGYAERAYELIYQEKDRHSQSFWNDNNNSAVFWHAIAVSAHDLDKNELVKTAAEKDILCYKSQKKFYSQYISMINLFDSLMALGQLQEADKTAAAVFELVENRYYLHVDDILHLCYANLLQTEGRIMESLLYYETGLKLSNKIQKWDYLYGSIWRELAIAKFGDYSCLPALLKYRNLAKESGYNYLVSMANCYYIIAEYILRRDPKAEMNDLYNEIIEIGMPGHILQATICQCLQQEVLSEDNKKMVFAQLSKCDGIKGSPGLIKDFWTCFEERMNSVEKEEYLKWMNKYTLPILKYQDEFRKNNCRGLNRVPILGKFNCMQCQAKCCYDGVYITDKEEKRINDFVAMYPEDFEDIKRPFIVNGDWPGMRSKRKTERRSFDGYDIDFPKHFTKTRCVFAMESGECKLQRVATDQQLHPWSIKPRACWSFPIQGVKNDDIIPPASDPENDPDYVDENYPGYASFLPCAVVDNEQGDIWYEKYQNEVEYYRYLIRNRLL